MNIPVDIKDKLIALGAREEEIKDIVGDVNEVVLLKAYDQYLASLSKEQQEQLETLSDEEKMKYVENNSELPTLSQEQLSAIATKVWEDYFKTMTSVE